MLELIRRLFGFCEHEFVFEKTIEEQNLRGGYTHLSHIYKCAKCPKREVREESFLEEPDREDDGDNAWFHDPDMGDR